MAKNGSVLKVGGKIYVSQEIAAAVAGVSVATFINWKKEGKAPPIDEQTRMYDAVLLGKWAREVQKFETGKAGRQPKGAPDRETSTKTDEETRYKKLQADLKELELAERVGSLILYDEVSTALENMVMRVRTKMLRLPVAAAPDIVGVSSVIAVQKTLEQIVRDALDELSTDWRDGIEKDDEDGGDS